MRCAETWHKHGIQEFQNFEGLKRVYLECSELPSKLLLVICGGKRPLWFSRIEVLWFFVILSAKICLQTFECNFLL
ncbi:hypothetical protein P8452_38145 [Trifolium repens]|nr:hypothetical protein QL285_070224 [Trifolium repens]WJX51993.1 hypothetical protein P8452_38145 [Trifolium repens]